MKSLGPGHFKPIHARHFPRTFETPTANSFRDGTFACSNIPGLFYFPGRIPLRLESGHGKWRLIREDGNQEIQLNFDAIDNWPDQLPFGTQLPLSPNRLEFFLGDADEGRTVEFEKH
jgi:hypothetical protein